MKTKSGTITIVRAVLMQREFNQRPQLVLSALDVTGEIKDLGDSWIISDDEKDTKAPKKETITKDKGLLIARIGIEGKYSPKEIDIVKKDLTRCILKVIRKEREEMLNHYAECERIISNSLGV